MKEVILPNRISAVVFDVNGTMISDRPLDREAFNRWGKRHGISMTDELYHEKVSGRANSDIFPSLMGDSLFPDTISTFAEEKEELYRLLVADRLDALKVKGLLELIKKLKLKKIPLGVATTAPEKNRTLILRGLGLDGKFDVVTGEEHVKKGKPDPEIYKKTFKSLGALPQKGVVFEDSPSGIEAAHRAKVGMIIGVGTSHSFEELKAHGATHYITDFTQVEMPK
jgi:beta-phosphoglucomutase